MITRAKLSTIEQGLPKYRSMLAGNEAFIPSNFESIATFNISSTTASVTFTSIPQTYLDLHLRMFVRNSGVQTGVNIGCLMRFNGDTSNSYARFGVNSNGVSVAASNAITEVRAVLGDGVVGGGSTTGIFGGYIVDIHDYTSTTTTKALRTIGGAHNTTNQYAHSYSNLWNSNSAITSIEVFPENDSWATGSIIALYGIKGA